jgi:5-(hydroxymethyl)furfural/furfural oxidase
MDLTREVDILIVGGGSAGCVLAARLSERPDLTVALAEAGDDTTPDAVPEDIASRYPGRAYFNPRYSWPDLRVTLGAAHLNDPARRPQARYEQARIMGGGSSINGIGVNYGAPADYDEWHEAGARGWRWDDVLPYFRKAERDLDLATPGHGTSGPIPVRRVPEAEWSGFTRAVGDAFAALGQLPFLRKVYLYGTKVTPDGVAAFRRARPGVEVNVGGTP